MTIDYLKCSVVLILIISILLNLNGKINTDKKRRASFCILSTILLSFISAIRGNTVGADTISYIREYEYYSNYSILQIIKKNPSAWGFYSMGKLFHNLGMDVHIMFFIIALFFNAMVFFLIYKNSKDIVLSYVLYISTGLFGFSLAGMKQICAISFCILAYLLYQKSGRRIIPIFIIVIASFFHQTAIIFIISLLIDKIKINKRNNIIALCISIIVFISGSNILRSFISFLANVGNRFGYYIDNVSEYSLTIFYIQLLIVLVYAIYYGSINNTEHSGLFYCGVIVLWFFFLNQYVSSMFRVGYYFLAFNYIVYPDALCGEKNRTVQIGTRIGSMVVFLSYFFFFSQIKYVTMWAR